LREILFLNFSKTSPQNVHFSKIKKILKVIHIIERESLGIKKESKRIKARLPKPKNPKLILKI